MILMAVNDKVPPYKRPKIYTWWRLGTSAKMLSSLVFPKLEVSL